MKVLRAVLRQIMVTRRRERKDLEMNL